MSGNSLAFPQWFEKNRSVILPAIYKREGAEWFTVAELADEVSEKLQANGYAPTRTQLTHTLRKFLDELEVHGGVEKSSGRLYRVLPVKKSSGV